MSPVTLFGGRSGGLYAISDGHHDGLAERVAAAIRGGAGMVQYRDKGTDATRRLAQARELAALCARHHVPLVINDDVALAAASGAEGVHLGRDDGAIADARAQLGDDAIIGASCYDDLELARQHAAQGASYLAFGSFFPSSSKPDAVRAAPDLLTQARDLGLPLVAIGGITADNGAALLAAGADWLAVISALFDAPDVCAAAKLFSPLFDTEKT